MVCTHADQFINERQNQTRLLQNAPRTGWRSLMFTWKTTRLHAATADWYRTKMRFQQLQRCTMIHLRTTQREERGWRVHPGQQCRLCRLPHVFTLQRANAIILYTRRIKKRRNAMQSRQNLETIHNCRWLHYCGWWSGVVVSALAWINEVNQSRARLVLRWVTVSWFNSRWGTFISVYDQPPRSTQPGHPFVGRRNEYQPKGDECLAAVE